MTVEKTEGGLAGYSIKTFLITALGIILFGIYIGVLLYGENSLMVLNQLQEEESRLLKEKIALKKENQRLQKEFFELKQLESKE